MANYKFILKTGIISTLFIFSYVTVKNLPEKQLEVDPLSTIEDLIKETNFKLEFKNLNELEYTVQDSTVDIKNTGINKSFKNNNKFDILINDTGKISSINYTSDLSDMNSSDIEYLKKIYNFVFGSISSFMFEKTTETLQKIQSEEYISLNKSLISEKGYIHESISLSKTSELKFTIYYESKQDSFVAYKVSLDILQGNKW